MARESSQVVEVVDGAVVGTALAGALLAEMVDTLVEALHVVDATGQMALGVVLGRKQDVLEMPYNRIIHNMYNTKLNEKINK